jgi:N-acetylmuramic acid 6-phosphate etherase
VQQNNIITGVFPVMQQAHSQTAQFPIDVVVGPEFVTGSSEWKLEPHKN